MPRENIDIPEITEPRLYIIMRRDLYQMNPGKGMAQAAHAANLFEHNMKNRHDNTYLEALNEWHGTLGFGVTITLQANKADMHEIAAIANGKNVPTDIVTDPTYPYTNFQGEYFTAEEETCMYVFVSKDTPRMVLEELRKYPLHP